VRLEAILCDFGGTLDADGVAWKERFARLFASEGVRVEAARFDPAFYASCDILVGAIPRDLSLAGTVRRIASGVGERLDLDPALVARVARLFLDASLEQLAASRALLTGLKHRFRLGVVSNFYGNLSHVLSEAGFGAVLAVSVDSAVVGASKPDPRIFTAALDALGLSPGDAVFVGDSQPRDMAGARGIGMPHVWLSPQPTGTVCCPGDRVIGRLADLPEALGVEVLA
jgi:putative hydrolase of the HAD superfamily